MSDTYKSFVSNTLTKKDQSNCLISILTKFCKFSIYKCFDAYNLKCLIYSVWCSDWCSD